MKLLELGELYVTQVRAPVGYKNILLVGALCLNFLNFS